MATALIARADPTSSTLSKTATQIIAAASSLRITRSFLFACLSLALYDHALIFDVEVKKIWKARWTPVKCAYIVIRVCNWTYLVANIHSKYYVLDCAPPSLPLFTSNSFEFALRVGSSSLTDSRY
jgi:hypothetical protein